MQPKQYRLASDGLKITVKRSYLRLIIIMIAAIATGLLIAGYNDKDGDQFSTLVVALPISTLLVGMSLRNAMKKQQEILKSYVLTIDGNTIRREQQNTPTIEIYHREVKNIIKTKNGMLQIISTDPAGKIYVPAQIEHYNELISTLESIRPITTKATASFFEQYGVPIVIAILGLMVWVFISQNKLVVALGGAILAATLIWSLVEGKRSKSIDERTKRGLWWIGVVLFALVYKIIAVLAELN